MLVTYFIWIDLSDLVLLLKVAKESETNTIRAWITKHVVFEILII